MDHGYIYCIFYSWMRHWPITQQQKLSQSRSDNRSKIHVYFCIGIPPQNIYSYYIFASIMLVSQMFSINITGEYIVKYSQRWDAYAKMYMDFTWLWQLPALVQPCILSKLMWDIIFKLNVVSGAPQTLHAAINGNFQGQQSRSTVTEIYLLLGITIRTFLLNYVNF